MRIELRVALVGLVATLGAVILSALLTERPAPGISISAIRNGGSCDVSYVFDMPVDSVPHPPREDDPDYEAEWADYGPRVGAGDANQTKVSINVASRDTRQVVITGVRLIAEKRAAPPGGVVVTRSCGGAIEERHIVFDLDTRPPRVVDSASVVHDDLTSVPLTFPYAVTDEDTAQLLLIARTTGCDCLWHASLSWQSGAEKGEYRIDLDGKPFHTVGAKDLPEYLVSGDGRLIPNF